MGARQGRVWAKAMEFREYFHVSIPHSLLASWSFRGNTGVRDFVEGAYDSLSGAGDFDRAITAPPMAGISIPDTSTQGPISTSATCSTSTALCKFVLSFHYGLVDVD